MKHRTFGFARACLVLLALLLPVTAQAKPAETREVVLAGGCFWGMQAVFESLKGVTSTTAGFSGGQAATAHYEIVSTGETGHAESVDVKYDPSKISFKQLLDVYFLVAHDPTELNRQGPDEGSQYRSEIFYTSDDQRHEAEAYIAGLRQRHVFPDPIVTKVEPMHGFYAAEDYHQDFLVHNPDNPYIVFNDIPKLRALRQRFPSLVNNSSPAILVLK